MRRLQLRLVIQIARLFLNSLKYWKTSIATQTRVGSNSDDGTDCVTMIGFATGVGRDSPKTAVANKNEITPILDKPITMTLPPTESVLHEHHDCHVSSLVGQPLSNSAGTTALVFHGSANSIFMITSTSPAVVGAIFK